MSERERPGPTPVPPPPAGYAPRTVPEHPDRPVRRRRPAGLAGLLLLLAGTAAGLSLLLRWLPGSDLTGADLVRRGWDDLAAGGVARLLADGFWQPVAVVLAGAALGLLGLLVLVPARSHRALGVLALLVALVAAVAVAVPLAAVGWDAATIDTGLWCALAVPVLGLLGALSALATGPRRR
ncbi:hypothetical protein SAMN06893096_101260 [Geodermatophilus pulveris]|uniref:Uncharacterized protein n=1 Tax=Geodermatophilus pulveris TaxID=1564159 RepID=A0A239AVD0_9ACTN|nr:hypothetical protein [Geodermatophilus pulveris]SNR99666.1 hypothetical protein SAMN06893096_101260 [Geodermatophilus pulveris]